MADPEAAPLVNRTVRKKLVRRFPYSVVHIPPNLVVAPLVD
jgi:hypothetical protein